MRRKISLGPWFRPAFATLVAMRRLRGTPFDPFGRTEVRREERALLAEYRDVITRLAEDLTAGNHATAVEIAGLPDLVRGYEDVKIRTVAAYRARMAELLAEFSPGGESWSTASHSGSVR
jgi:indolepyruvate ferredoxin oxidoreductase